MKWTCPVLGLCNEIDCTVTLTDSMPWSAACFFAGQYIRHVNRKDVSWRVPVYLSKLSAYRQSHLNAYSMSLNGTHLTSEDRQYVTCALNFCLSTCQTACEKRNPDIDSCNHSVIQSWQAGLHQTWYVCAWFRLLQWCGWNATCLHDSWDMFITNIWIALGHKMLNRHVRHEPRWYQHLDRQTACLIDFDNLKPRIIVQITGL